MNATKEPKVDEMNRIAGKQRDEGGFVLPVVMFGLLLMSVIALLGLVTSEDEMRASRAMRESSAAFYAAEAGMNRVYAEWDSYQASIDALVPGDSLDLGWQSLDNGAEYRAVVHRWDAGDQPIYQLTVEGRGPGALSGQRRMSLTVTAGPGAPGVGYKIGECCDAAAVVRGTAIVEEGSVIDGHDEHPPGWEDAGVCADSLYDRPGIVMQDTDLLELDEGGKVYGEPAIQEDPTIDDDDFFQFGPDLTWDDIKAMADVVIGTPGDGIELTGSQIYPRYNVDGSCDTSHPYNWGSDDPNDPCFGHFPIILVRGDVALENVYGQGVIILDYWTEDGENMGTEFDLEDQATFNGIILGKGCVEIQRNSILRGAVFADGNYGNPLCGSDLNLDMNKSGDLKWSQCAVDRAMLNSGLKDYAEPSLGGGGGGLTRLVSRAFGESY